MLLLSPDASRVLASLPASLLACLVTQQIHKHKHKMMCRTINPPHDEAVMSKHISAASIFYTLAPDDVHDPFAIRLAHPHPATRSCPSRPCAPDALRFACKAANAFDGDTDVDASSTTCESNESSTFNPGDTPSLTEENILIDLNVRDNPSLTEENILIGHDNSSPDEMFKYRLSLALLCPSAEPASKAHEPRICPPPDLLPHPAFHSILCGGMLACPGRVLPPPPPCCATDSQRARESRESFTTTTTPEKVEAAQSAAVSKRERAGSEEEEASGWGSEDDVPLSEIASRFKEEARRSKRQRLHPVHVEPPIGELFDDVLRDLEGTGGMSTDDLVALLDDLDPEGVVQMVMDENIETEPDFLWRVGLS